MTHRRRAKNNPPDPTREPAFYCWQISYPATKLGCNFCSRKNLVNRISIDGRACKSTIQINKMEMRKPLRLEGRGLCRRVIIKDRCTIHIPLLKSYARAIF